VCGPLDLDDPLVFLKRTLSEAITACVGLRLGHDVGAGCLTAGELCVVADGLAPDHSTAAHE
jgi:hypothetical protein